jgi:thymidylate synthase (FAD)
MAYKLYGVRTPVGQHGHVTLVDFMGSDYRVVEAARVSFDGAASKGEEQDRRLIHYLMKNKHTSPFEQCELVFDVYAPLFVARQWLRHRTASVNEQSRRYTGPEDSEVVIWGERVAGLHLREQGTGTNKQGSGELIGDDPLNHLFTNTVTKATEAYKALIDEGLCREQARAVLPQGMYTRFVYKQDLHNLLHFLELRLHPHAQKEIREYAEVMAKMVQTHFPKTWEAFEEYRLHAVTLSKSERTLLADAMKDNRWDDATVRILDKIRP